MSVFTSASGSGDAREKSGVSIDRNNPGEEAMDIDAPPISDSSNSSCSSTRKSTLWIRVLSSRACWRTD